MSESTATEPTAEDLALIAQALPRGVDLGDCDVTWDEDLGTYVATRRAWEHLGLTPPASMGLPPSAPDLFSGE